MSENHNDDNDNDEGVQEVLACVICGNDEEYINHEINRFRVTLLVCEHCAPGGSSYDEDAWGCECRDETTCTHLVPDEECEMCGSFKDGVKIHTGRYGVTKRVCDDCSPTGQMYDPPRWGCACVDRNKCPHFCMGCFDGLENQMGHSCVN